MRKLVGWDDSLIGKAKATHASKAKWNSFTTSHRQAGIQLSPGKQGSIHVSKKQLRQCCLRLVNKRQNQAPLTRSWWLAMASDSAELGIPLVCRGGGMKEAKDTHVQYLHFLWGSYWANSLMGCYNDSSHGAISCQQLDSICWYYSGHYILDTLLDRKSVV